MSLARPFRRRPALSVTGSPGPDARAGTGRAASRVGCGAQTVACAGLERWASLISGGRARRCSFFSCYLHTIIRFRLRSMYTHSSTIRLVRDAGPATRTTRGAGAARATTVKPTRAAWFERRGVVRPPCAYGQSHTHLRRPQSAGKNPSQHSLIQRSPSPACAIRGQHALLSSRATPTPNAEGKRDKGLSAANSPVVIVDRALGGRLPKSGLASRAWPVEAHHPPVLHDDTHF